MPVLLCSTDDISLTGRKPIALFLLRGDCSAHYPRQIIASSFKEKNLGKRFLLLDRELDKASYGPTWLKDARLAKIVADSLSHGAEQLRLYRLSAYVVMSNHVHILIWPKALLYQITKSIKGYTAHECNKLLDRTGEKFWQDESFDHSVRNEDAFYRIQKYIERNPVKAGLVETPEEWPWSSEGEGQSRTDIPVCP